MPLTKKVFPTLLYLCVCMISHAQMIPFNPISYRVFSPFILNPAIAGSKDFFSMDLLAGFTGQANSQILSGNARIMKKLPGYMEAPPIETFSNFGVGASAFNDYQPQNNTRTAGGSAVFAYHVPLDVKDLSFISVGISGKGVYHYYGGDTVNEIPSKKFIFPEVDFGIYFYNPSIFAGVSATNILPAKKDTSAFSPYRVPVSRQYNLLIGYKFVLSKALNLVLEPSLMLFTDDSLSFNAKENIEPVLKLYASRFCVGTYFNDYNKVSFFFQYRYPRFYVGTYFALPKETAYYKKSITAEIAVGLNLSRTGGGYTKNALW
jgi:type IX secretion system PorP/SprF family membrane protein